jgi:pilus assembly protein CpaC
MSWANGIRNTGLGGGAVRNQERIEPVLHGLRKAAVLMLAALMPLAAQALELLDLHAGGVKLLPVGEVERLVVGNDQAIGTSILEGGRLLLIGLQPGSSDLQVMLRDGRELGYSVTVHPRDIASVVGTVSALLIEFPEARVRAINGVVVADGWVPRSQLPAVQELIRQIPGVVSLIEAKTPPIELVMQSFPLVKVREVNGVMIVDGEVSEADRLRFDNAIAQFPNAVSLVRITQFEPAPMIRVALRIIEVNRESSRRIGINWDSSFAGPSIGSTGASITNSRFRIVPSGLDGITQNIGLDDARWFAYAGWTTRVFSAVNLLALDNQATTLAEPNLTTRSGEPAVFFAGGEFPYPVIGTFGQPGVEFKPYGIRFEILPTADQGGNIQTVLKAEISTLDRANQVADVQGLLKRETESTVTLHAGETMIISGLVSADEVRNMNGVPGLSKIPVLGELFKSRNFQDRKSELVVMVTPYIVEKGEAPGEGLQAVTRRMRNLVDQQILEGALAE